MSDTHPAQNEVFEKLLTIAKEQAENGQFKPTPADKDLLNAALAAQRNNAKFDLGLASDKLKEAQLNSSTAIDQQIYQTERGHSNGQTAKLRGAAMTVIEGMSDALRDIDAAKSAKGGETKAALDHVVRELSKTLQDSQKVADMAANPDNQGRYLDENVKELHQHVAVNIRDAISDLKAAQEANPAADKVKLVNDALHNKHSAVDPMTLQPPETPRQLEELAELAQLVNKGSKKIIGLHTKS